MSKDNLTRIDLVMANAYIEALICGVGIVKVTRLSNGQMELDSVPREEFYDLGEELRWRGAAMLNEDDK